MVECGKVDKFFFDFGSGCMRNIIANQIPVPEINDVFLTHLHVDHYADLPYVYAFGPSAMRWKPLRAYGPSGRAPELGTKAMMDAMKKMAAWHIQSFTSLPCGEGYEMQVTEFDFKEKFSGARDNTRVRSSARNKW